MKTSLEWWMIIHESQQLINQLVSCHSHASLKSNWLTAIPNAWNRLSGCLNYRKKVFSSILPNTSILSAASFSLYAYLSSIKMKFFIEACLTLFPKFNVKEFIFSFHLGCLFLNWTTVDPGRVDKDYFAENLYMSKSYKHFALGILTFSLRGPFIPKMLV